MVPLSRLYPLYQNQAVSSQIPSKQRSQKKELPNTGAVDGLGFTLLGLIGLATASRRRKATDSK